MRQYDANGNNEGQIMISLQFKAYRMLLFSQDKHVYYRARRKPRSSFQASPYFMLGINLQFGCHSCQVPIYLFFLSLIFQDAIQPSLFKSVKYNAYGNTVVSTIRGEILILG